MAYHHAPWSDLRKKKNVIFFLLNETILLFHIAQCHIATLALCALPLPSFANIPPFALVVPTFLHLFPLSFVTCLFRERTLDTWPFFIEELVGHVPDSRTLLTTYELTWVQEGRLFQVLAYIVYTREEYYFSRVCTSRKVINIFKVKVDVQKGALRFREKNNKRFVSFVHFMFSSIVDIWS